MFASVIPFSDDKREIFKNPRRRLSTSRIFFFFFKRRRATTWSFLFPTRLINIFTATISDSYPRKKIWCYWRYFQRSSRTLPGVRGLSLIFSTNRPHLFELLFFRKLTIATSTLRRHPLPIRLFFSSTN